MESFIAKSPQSIKVLNVLRVSATLPVNILIEGERGTGKETLVNTVFKNIPKFSVKDLEEHRPQDKEIFIRDFENVSDVMSFMGRFKEYRIIAASTKSKELYEDYFPVRIFIPPLSQRPEDLEELKRIYIQKAMREFELEKMPEQFDLDLSANAISLKRSIYERALLEKLDEGRFMRLCEEFFASRLERGYRELLSFFEIPLLRAAKKRYKSALAISKVLGLNRATLTSKLKKYQSKL
ncbi:MAG: hypothetical protein C6H99_07320 [Epsilonproteobacteria bacterium]|nr:hypothetical protein [Campylobacterota bacterium]NPA63540.1 hypothetical protein [Campylobacterota bacterium]